MAEKSIEEELNIFFQNPNDIINVHKSSILHLLRRDIFRCMGYIDNKNYHELEKDPQTETIIWPGIMVVLAGIDLLGKFFSGEDEQKKVGHRFKNYCEEYLDVDEKEADVIYQLRNSLLHSFGLLSKKYSRRQGKRTTIYYYFKVSWGNEELIELLSDKNNEKYYKIDLKVLWDKFEKGIEKYEKDLRTDNELKNNFHKMFKYYGMIQKE